MAALLHDIGKLSIPDEVLKKEGRLTDTEFNMIKTHATNGIDYIINDPKLCASDIVKNSIVHHHESYDGFKGYPDNTLTGKNIPEEARVVAVFDVYDALSSKRQYKEPYPQEQVFKMLREDNKLDQEIVAEAIDFIKERDRGRETIGHDIGINNSLSENMKRATEKAQKQNESQHTTQSSVRLPGGNSRRYGNC